MTALILAVGAVSIVCSVAMVVVLVVLVRAFRRGFRSGVEDAHLAMWDAEIGGDQ